MRQWQVLIGIGQGLIDGRNKFFTRYLTYGVKHALIQHIPGTELLADHLFAGGLEVQIHMPVSGAQQ